MAAADLKRLTEADFESLSWHDNNVYGFALRTGDPERGDWTCDFELDIDYIAEWVLDDPDGWRFRVAPATLAFHGITDLRIQVDWGSSGFAASPPNLASIDGIEREPIADQRVFLDRPYYRWRIALNSPRSGEIRFGAVGFTQTLRADPAPCAEQYLPPGERERSR